MGFKLPMLQILCDPYLCALNVFSCYLFLSCIIRRWILYVCVFQLMQKCSFRQIPFSFFSCFLFLHIGESSSWSATGRIEFYLSLSKSSENSSLNLIKTFLWIEVSEMKQRRTVEDKVEILLYLLVTLLVVIYELNYYSNWKDFQCVRNMLLKKRQRNEQI